VLAALKELFVLAVLVVFAEFEAFGSFPLAVFPSDESSQCTLST